MQTGAVRILWDTSFMLITARVHTENSLIHVCLATEYNFLSWNSQAPIIVFWSLNFLKKKASPPGHLHAPYTESIMIKWVILCHFLVVIMTCHLVDNIAKYYFLCDSKRQTQNCICFPKRILIKLLMEELYSSWQDVSQSIWTTRKVNRLGALWHMHVWAFKCSFEGAQKAHNHDDLE